MGVKGAVLAGAAFSAMIALLCWSVWPCFGIIYRTTDKAVMRIILPDSNSELYEQPLSDDEEVLIVPYSRSGDAYGCGRMVDVYACARLVKART